MTTALQNCQTVQMLQLALHVAAQKWESWHCLGILGTRSCRRAVEAVGGVAGLGGRAARTTMGGRQPPIEACLAMIRLPVPARMWTSRLTVASQTRAAAPVWAASGPPSLLRTATAAAGGATAAWAAESPTTAVGTAETDVAAGLEAVQSRHTADALACPYRLVPSGGDAALVHGRVSALLGLELA
ncbi:hypothetical protein BC831DRAFT_458219 [Entophlyctis helioformis]|nr:hypothetical protein BC831DRAFT_458219 [Entophlyctis helioformis]